MEYLSHPTFSACYRHGLALLCGLFWAAAAQANPPLYVCPGPLFTNDLAPAQAKARGCELAARGRLSQAQDSPLQAMAAVDTAPGPALAATPPRPASTPASTPVSIPASTPASTPALAPSLAPSSAPVSAPSSVTSMTAVSTASLPAASAASAASTAVATSPPTANAPRKGPEPADASRQRQRDSHAREIVLAELARTQARIQALSAQPPAGPEAQSALQRLQRDEDALRRELARRPG